MIDNSLQMQAGMTIKITNWIPHIVQSQLRSDFTSIVNFSSGNSWYFGVFSFISKLDTDGYNKWYQYTT